jgi:hypothetical protein
MNNRSRRRKSRSADMALENHQLVAEDRKLDVAVQIVRGAGDQPHHTTQQEIQQSEQHVPNLPRHEGGPILRTTLVTEPIDGFCAEGCIYSDGGLTSGFPHQGLVGQSGPWGSVWPDKEHETGVWSLDGVDSSS